MKAPRLTWAIRERRGLAAPPRRMGKLPKCGEPGNAPPRRAAVLRRFRTSRSGRIAAALLGAAVLWPGWAPTAYAGQAGAARSRPPNVYLKVNPPDAATEDGFLHFYNMEYEAATRDFEQSLREHPRNPFCVNHLLESVLFHELHREGKLDAQLYLSNEFVHMPPVAPDPQAMARVAELMQRARALEEALLAKNPNDIEALYARSVTWGLRAAQQALVGKQWFAALRSGLAAYNDSKRVLALDPNYSDAKLIVGIYNYVVGSLPWPVKIAMLLVTIHGSRPKGLALMREAMAGGGEASIDARTTLALFLARERQYGQALELIGWLYARFPHNFLYGLSEGDLLRKAGRIPEAMGVYRQLIEGGRQGLFPYDRSGLAAMNLGDTLRSEKDWRAAAEAYDRVEVLPNSTPELVADARLDAGKMYDRAGERAQAVRRYKEVVAAGASAPDLASEAKKWLARPYAGD